MQVNQSFVRSPDIILSKNVIPGTVWRDMATGKCYLATDTFSDSGETSRYFVDLQDGTQWYYNSMQGMEIVKAEVNVS